MNNNIANRHIWNNNSNNSKSLKTKLEIILNNISGIINENIELTNKNQKDLEYQLKNYDNPFISDVRTQLQFCNVKLNSYTQMKCDVVKMLAYLKTVKEIYGK